MAKYLILIYGDEQRWDAETEPELRAKDEGHRAFNAVAGSRVLGGHELEASSTATTLRGAGLVTDGPFLESKEYLAGFWVIDAPDLDVALALAAQGSRSCNRRVEVRPFLGE